MVTVAIDLSHWYNSKKNQFLFYWYFIDIFSIGFLFSISLILIEIYVDLIIDSHAILTNNIVIPCDDSCLLWLKFSATCGEPRIFLP